MGRLVKKIGLGLAFIFFNVFCISFLWFSIFEIFPDLLDHLDVESIPYYAYRKRYAYVEGSILSELERLMAQ